MKDYEEVRIEVKNPEDLKKWDSCCYCERDLTYRDGECWCERCKKEFIFYIVNSK